MISIIFTFLGANDIDLDSFKSIINQKQINYNIFICTNNETFIRNLFITKSILPSEVIFFINLKIYNTYNKVIDEIISVSNPEFIVFHENTIVSSEYRLYTQYNFLITNPDLTCCSCLANTLDCSEYFSTEACDFENTFSTPHTIDEAFLGYYIPFSLSSLFIKATYLKLILNYSINTINILDKISFILFIAKYTPITKVPMQLITYKRFTGYKNYSRKMNIFNLSKTIELREYLNYSIVDNTFEIDYLNTNSLNILIILDKANLGGTETYVYSLIKCLLLNGVNVALASVYGLTYPIIKKLGIKFINIDYDIKKSLPILYEFISNNKVDLIHCNLENSMQLGKTLKEKYDIPLVITLHGTFYSHEILKDTCSYADSIISVSKPVDTLIKSLLTNNERPKHYIVNNGISFDNNIGENIFEKLSLNKDSKLIIYCSRLGVGKGKLALNVLYSLKDLLTLKADLHLIIIGEGFSKFEIENHATMFNEAIGRTAVICTGAIYNVKDYFSKASVVIGTGRVLMEALSVNTPVISYGLEGLIGIVTPYNRDRIMDTHFGDHDFIDLTENRTLSEMIKYILDEKELFATYSSSNYQWCNDNFNEIINTNSIIDIYNFSLNKPPKHYP